jgi:hypothetical protein
VECLCVGREGSLYLAVRILPSQAGSRPKTAVNGIKSQGDTLTGAGRIVRPGRKPAPWPARSCVKHRANLRD